ncbi:MAG: ATP-dependent RNA helicase HrpA, partial [Gammaproteobacteria bacterium]|nr:ATP-dependent RNA helicase HrpA [Gammaproteobacteria bacterium]
NFLPVRFDYPQNLPISAKIEELIEALNHHQVIVVCGETGSGKTTQLPKAVLHWLQKQRPTSRQMIGHTQPRRLAASSVAKRIASELNTPLGQIVGYKIRFTDQVSPQTRIKLMTDGILLAETQSDRWLSKYAAIIIDEAHERNLNIDFLLGYLKNLLPHRKDLKIIVTSATIDPQLFAKHFSSTDQETPIYTVSGRTYPVEIRWQPQDVPQLDLPLAIENAIFQLWTSPTTFHDILVFLPGEREIYEAQEHLSGVLAHQPQLRQVKIIPLFSRNAHTVQEAIFQPSSTPRIILATNIAETSLTLPSIHYVIDSGLARINRYNYRSKVEQLHIEPISQAAANQRSGRCGRVANGICIRLYSEEDFANRPPYTEPEIMRTSLAGVILKMKVWQLGDINAFPFLQSPKPKAIGDALELLSELGAFKEDSQELNEWGLGLSQLPLDPRIGRMLLEAKKRNCLRELLVITAGISVQDIKDNPEDKATQAEQAHAKFKDPKSEFMFYWRLWDWLEEQRQTQLSRRQFDKLLQTHYIHVKRYYEWRDVYTQITLMTRQFLGKPNTEPASFEQIHCSILSGLLGNIGYKVPHETHFQGTRGLKFYIHPSSKIHKKTAKFIVCSELVETTKLYARCLAHIDSRWIESVGLHVLRKQVLNPQWHPTSSKVLAMERATLYGILVYSARPINYAQIDPQHAREIFIRQAIVSGEWNKDYPFLRENRKNMEKIDQYESRVRKTDFFYDPDLLWAFYHQLIPGQVCDGVSFETWYTHELQQRRKQKWALDWLVYKPEIMSEIVESKHKFPPLMRIGQCDCKVSYLHQPGQANDGITVYLPLIALNQAQPLTGEWLVLGMLAEKILAILKSLPQKIRSPLSPLNTVAGEIFSTLSQPEHFGVGSLIEKINQWLLNQRSILVTTSDYRLENLPPHLLLNYQIIDEHGGLVGKASRHLDQLQAQYAQQSKGAFDSLKKLIQDSSGKQGATDKQEPADDTHPTPRTHLPLPTNLYTNWSFGNLQDWAESLRRQFNLSDLGYPAIVDKEHSVGLELFDDAQKAQLAHHAGLRRLIVLQLPQLIKNTEKTLDSNRTLSLVLLGVGKDLAQQIIRRSLDRAFLYPDWPTNAHEFQHCLKIGQNKFTLITKEIVLQLETIFQLHNQIKRQFSDKFSPLTVADCQRQLQGLFTNHFIDDTPWEFLQHYPRYLKGILARLEKSRHAVHKDHERMLSVNQYEERYRQLLNSRKGQINPTLKDFKWLLEEFRISLFAQELKTAQIVSPKRLDKVLAGF